MKTLARSRSCFVSCLLLLPTLALAAAGDSPAPRHRLAVDVVFGGGSDPAAKATVDTQFVMGPWGSGAPYNGQFESPNGAPAWNGWSSRDLTASDVTYWHADTYGAVSGTWSAWCGTLAYPACSPTDSTGGYGNNWNETLEWRGAVANPADPCTVSVSATVEVEAEPGYDIAYLTAVKSGGPIDLWISPGYYEPQPMPAVETVYGPGDYVGAGGDEVVVQFRFESDGGWSDEDCMWPTNGAVRVDDVVITLSNGTGYSHDFEDGTLGDFTPRLAQGVGDFAKLWVNLAQPGHCGHVNQSAMVAFIDDGEVVPGTGGTPCQTFCYGPGGYIVNNTGGLAGPDAHIHNAIESPVMEWPGSGYEGATLAFDVWQHEILAANSPGIFFTWSIRSTVDTDPATIATQDWRDRNFLYYGGPGWKRQIETIGDLVPADAAWVQIQLTVYEMGWAWGWIGTDGTPAPYFDNVRLQAYPYAGPSLSATVISLPHDGFPDGGVLDLADLGANSVRFDSGQDINQYLWNNGPNAPGDSIVVTVKPLREGATLVGMPRLVWSLKRNPVFDPYRTAGLPDQGSRDAWPAMRNGSPVPDVFAFDLPDTGFLFPGDFLYYYFEATDEAGGVQLTSTLPADTTGFGNFDDPMAYPPIYKLHALPTLSEDPGAPGTYVQPSILFWDDAGAVGNRDEWYMAFRNLGLVAGVDYDIYYTNGPSAGSGQGLGGRSTANQLAGYDELIYTSGVQTSSTISDGTGSNGDTSEDAQVLMAWLEQGGKDMLLTGDDLAGDITRNGGSPALTFLQTWMGVDLADENVLGLIDLQTSPMVMVDQPSPVFADVDYWRGVANCLSVSAGYYGSGSTTTGNKRYDGVVPRVGAARLAEFADPGGQIGAYAFSAATLNVRADFNSRVISLPYDFQSVETADDGGAPGAPLAARVRLLQDVLAYFGAAGGSSQPSDVPDAQAFSAGSHPNPFNPATVISWTLPRAGRLTVQVYDVRGRLVRTLLDERRDAGPGEVRWDGCGDGGRAAAAGVYFYSLRTDEETLVGKMAMIK